MSVLASILLALPAGLAFVLAIGAPIVNQMDTATATLHIKEFEIKKTYQVHLTTHWKSYTVSPTDDFSFNPRTLDFPCHLGNIATIEDLCTAGKVWFVFSLILACCAFANIFLSLFVRHHVSIKWVNFAVATFGMLCGIVATVVWIKLSDPALEVLESLRFVKQRPGVSPFMSMIAGALAGITAFGSCFVRYPKRERETTFVGSSPTQSALVPALN